MPWRWTNPDARPVSDYLYNYYIFRRNHRFLFYCRECVRNFDAKERIETCPRCGQASLIELPKDIKFARGGGRKGRILTDLRKGSVDSAKRICSFIFSKLRTFLWKLKIALLYATTSVPDELV